MTENEKADSEKTNLDKAFDTLYSPEGLKDMANSVNKVRDWLSKAYNKSEAQENMLSSLRGNKYSAKFADKYILPANHEDDKAFSGSSHAVLTADKAAATLEQFNQIKKHFIDHFKTAQQSPHYWLEYNNTGRMYQIVAGFVRNTNNVNRMIRQQHLPEDERSEFTDIVSQINAIEPNLISDVKKQNPNALNTVGKAIDLLKLKDETCQKNIKLIDEAEKRVKLAIDSQDTLDVKFINDNSAYEHLSAQKTELTNEHEQLSRLLGIITPQYNKIAFSYQTLSNITGCHKDSPSDEIKKASANLILEKLSAKIFTEEDGRFSHSLEKDLVKHINENFSSDEILELLNPKHSADMAEKMIDSFAQAYFESKATKKDLSKSDLATQENIKIHEKAKDHKSPLQNPWSRRIGEIAKDAGAAKA